MKFLKCYGDCQGPTDIPTTTEVARDLEKKLESGEWSPFRLNKGVSEAFLPGERADISVITDGSVDLEGEMVNPDGLVWGVFKKRPVVTFNHNYNIPPVGKSLWQKKVTGGVWKAKTQYTSRPKDHPSEREWFPDSIFHMIKEGSLPGKSIGGLQKRRDPTVEEKERGIKKVIDQVLILEYSVTPIQANTNALVESITKGTIFIPYEILQDSFPEIYEQVKDTIEEGEEQTKQLETLVIKSFVTPEQHKKKSWDRFEEYKREIIESIPKRTEDTIKRLSGKVS